MKYNFIYIERVWASEYFVLMSDSIRSFYWTGQFEFEHEVTREEIGQLLGGN